MHSVSSDEDITLVSAAVLGDCHRKRRVRLVGGSHLRVRVQVDNRSGQRGIRAHIDEHLVKVRAVEVPVRRPELLPQGVAERPTGQDLAVAPPSTHLAGRLRLDRFQLGPQAGVDQDPARVGRSLDAGTDLPEFVGLLQHGDLHADTAQQVGRGETTEASARDDDSVNMVAQWNLLKQGGCRAEVLMTTSQDDYLT